MSDAVALGIAGIAASGLKGLTAVPHQKGLLGYACLRGRGCALLAILVLIFAVSAGGARADVRAVGAANQQTVVSLTFDHNLQYQIALGPLLAKYGMNATFFVNSGLVRTNSSYYMDWSDLQALYAGGNEIGGHTVTHADPAKLTLDQQRNEVCVDRATLVAHGFQAVSFAHPYGADRIGETIVRGCGYNSARSIGGPALTCGGNCNYTETIPPAKAFATRTTPHIRIGTQLTTLQSYVTAAESKGGGWVQFLATHICDGCDEYSVPLPTIEAFLAWLKPRAAQGTIVRTVGQVIAGAPQPLQTGPFARDTVSPVITSLSLTRRSFRVAKAATPVAARAKRGTAFRYTLSEPATVTIEIQRKRRCRRGATCKRYRSVGTLTRKAAQLRNGTRFSGRIGKKALRRGRYRAVVRATDSGGNRSAPRRASFKIVRR
jgi:hypothetical protein